MKIGVIGCGKMATALIKGAIESKVIAASDVTGVSRSERSRQMFANETGANVVNSIVKVVENADVVMIATKPQDAEAALKEALSVKSDHQILISVIAGMKIEQLSKAFGDHSVVVRSMPNTPSLVGKGAAGVCFSEGCSESQRKFAISFFEAVGVAIEIPEKSINAVTGLSGSGPAYVFTIIEALADGGVREGLSRENALKLATQTVLGAASMVEKTGEHPAVLRDKVTSPGGTTIAGVASLEDSGIRSALINAVRAAARRADELGAG